MSQPKPISKSLSLSVLVRCEARKMPYMVWYLWAVTLSVVGVRLLATATNSSMPRAFESHEAADTANTVVAAIARVTSTRLTSMRAI